MASPINTIRKQQLTEEQIMEQNLENLKLLLSENKDTINQLFIILKELNNIGALEAASKLLEAKEEVAEIALNQLNREPTTNMINNIMNTASLLTVIDPETTTKLVNSLTNGLDEAKNAVNNDEKIGIYTLLKLLDDPDINRGLKFGFHFLKGFGKSLK